MRSERELRALLDPYSHYRPEDYVPPPLTLAQKRAGKRARIQGLIKWHPDWSDRAIAREVGCNKNVVAAVRGNRTLSGRKFGKSFWLTGWKS